MNKISFLNVCFVITFYKRKRKVKSQKRKEKACFTIEQIPVGWKKNWIIWLAILRD